MLHLISKGLNLPGESEMVRKVLRLFLIKSKKVACCKDMEVTFLLTSPSTPQLIFPRFNLLRNCKSCISGELCQPWTELLQG